MNHRKWKQLFDAARNERPPSPPEGFDQRVLQAVRRNVPPVERKSASVLDQLNLLFPRVAWAAAAVIVLCIAGELASPDTDPGLSEDMAQLSEEWLLSPDGF